MDGGSNNISASQNLIIANMLSFIMQQVQYGSNTILKAINATELHMRANSDNRFHYFDTVRLVKFAFCQWIINMANKDFHNLVV